MTWFLDWQAHPRFRHLTRANVGEVLAPPVSPLGWTLGWERGVLKGWRDGSVEMGFFRDDEMPHDRPPVAAIMGGYLYLNMSAHRMYAVRMPGANVDQFDKAYFGDVRGLPPYEPHPQDDCPDCEEKVGEHLAMALSDDDPPYAVEDHEMSVQTRTERPDLEGLSDAELVARARMAVDVTCAVDTRALIVSILSGVGPAQLEAACDAVGRPELFMPLITGVGGVDSAASSIQLWELSRHVRGMPELEELFNVGVEGLWNRLRSSTAETAKSFCDEVEAFLILSGSRGPDEYDLYAEVWETRPDLALAHVDRLRRFGPEQDPNSKHARLQAERHRAENQMRDLLGNDAEGLANFEAALRSAHRYMQYRERYKTDIIRALHEARMAIRVLGARACNQGAVKDPKDVLMLTNDELDGFVPGDFAMADLLATRHEDYLQLARRQPPFFLVDGRPTPDEWPERSDVTSGGRAMAGDVLDGDPGCPGVGTGIARVLTSAADAAELEPGAVLVAPFTDPAWTPLFVGASAVVVDTGARNSHAVIICRELGTPCVVSATGATARIRDGARIEVDGTAGTVTILDD